MINTEQPGAARELRTEIVAYLRRESDGEGLGDAELAISELITNGARHAAGPLWVSIDWSGDEPVLRVADVGPGFDLDLTQPSVDSIGGRGLFIVSRITTGLEANRLETGGSAVVATLRLRRAPHAVVDPS